MRSSAYLSRRSSFLPARPLSQAALIVLGVLLLSGLILRFVHIGAPLVDRHAWKQTDLAGIARNYAHGGMRVGYPQIDWGGDSTGYAEMEFPLISYVAAFLYGPFGEHEAIGRLLNIVAGMSLALLLFAYLRARVGLAAAFGSLVFTLFSPIAWFYGRTYMQEMTGWALALGALWFLDRGLARDWGDAVPYRATISAALLALALMCKLNTAVVMLPMLALIVERRGLDGVLRPWVLYALLGALVPPIVWYVHAHGLYQQTGLTFGVLGTGHDKFQTFAFVTRISWWKEILGRVIRTVATPPGLLLVLIGLPGLRERGAQPFMWWGIAALLLTFVAAEGSLDMEYYQLVLVVPAAAAFGMGFALLWHRRRGWLRILSLVLVLATMVYGARRGLEMMAPTYTRQYAAGLALARVAQAGDLVVNLGAYSHHKGGDDFEPNIFYYSRTSGWVLRPQEYRMGLVDSLVERGARFAVTSRVREIRSQSGFLDSLDRRYPVVDSTADYRVWTLAQETP